MTSEYFSYNSISDTIALVNNSPAMDVDSPVDQPVLMDTTDATSSVTSSPEGNHLELWNAPNGHSAFQFTVSNGTTPVQNHLNNNPTGLSLFQGKSISSPERNWMNAQNRASLIGNFYEQFRTYLYLIGFINGEFRLLNEFYFEDEKESKKQAFIVLNGDGTICGVLFTRDVAGEIQTLFDVDDMRIKWEVSKYIDSLNRTDPEMFPVLQKSSDSNVTHASCDDTLMDGFRRLSNDSDAPNLSLSDENMETRLTTSHPLLSASTDVSNTTLHRPNTSAQATTNDAPGIPEIKIQLKPDWRLAYPKDLITKPRTGGHGVNEEVQTKLIGLVQGIGSQRSRPQVKVPLEGRRMIYLACEVRTIANEHHLLKAIVPEKTKVDRDDFNKENDLRYLRFNDCDPNHTMDGDRGVIYMKVTAEEHRQQFKNLPIYMFNLYQTSRITKDMIRREHLNKCRLAFWFVVKENGNYTSVSGESLSNVISERRK